MAGKKTSPSLIDGSNRDKKEFLKEKAKYFEELEQVPEKKEVVKPAKKDKKQTPTITVKTDYAVAKNKSITTMKGILASGAFVDESILIGGKEALNVLIENGYVIKTTA